MKIRISNLSLIYRDDILFYAFVIITGNRNAYKEFIGLHANRKAKKKNLYSIYKSIRKHGQKTPIKLVEVKGFLYPVSGVHRLASLISLNKKSVKSEKHAMSYSLEWNHKKILGSHHFQGLSEDTMNKFLLVRKSLIEKYNFRSIM